MSIFSIPTLRAMGQNVANVPATPVITIEQVGYNCIPNYNATITGPTGVDIYYNYGPYPYWPDPFCGDVDYSYSGTSPIILSNLTGSVGTNAVKAISCLNGMSSSVAIGYFGGGNCPTSITPPTIAYTQTSNISVSFTVTAQDCGTTYILWGTGSLVEASATAALASINTLTTETVSYSYSDVITGYDGPQAEENTYFISAVTVFQRDGCDTVSSTVTSVLDGPILE